MKETKTCFIIMPITDNPSYPVGHFKRVYEYIIKPACETAGFVPIRADDVVTTNYIALDIIKRIIESDMAICDLSSQNPNVMYELGIRQAFNKPVTFIKDNITKRIFDIQGFRDNEYDMTLRIDNVNIITEQLAETIIQTYENKETEINSLIKLLSISPAEVSENTKLTLESELILNQLNVISNRLDKIDKNETFVAAQPNVTFDIIPTKEILPDAEKLDFEALLSLKLGEKVFHERFGTGRIIELSGHGKDSKITIQFDVGGIKKLLLRFAPLYKL